MHALHRCFFCHIDCWLCCLEYMSAFLEVFTFFVTFFLYMCLNILLFQPCLPFLRCPFLLGFVWGDAFHCLLFCFPFLFCFVWPHWLVSFISGICVWSLFRVWISWLNFSSYWMTFHPPRLFSRLGPELVTSFICLFESSVWSLGILKVGDWNLFLAFQLSLWSFVSSIEELWTCRGVIVNCWLIWLLWFAHMLGCRSPVLFLPPFFLSVYFTWVHLVAWLFRYMFPSTVLGVLSTVTNIMIGQWSWC